MPTIEPVIGVVTAPTNVRNYPSKGIGDRLGGLLYNQRVNVIARNDRANWLYILFPESPSGAGWVTVKAIQLQGDLTRLPIALYASPQGAPTLYPPVLFDAPAAPLPINTPAPGVRTLRVNDLAYVRVCPSVGCMTLATLPGGTLLTVTGQADEKTWLQFDYPSGPNGRAWIAASLVTILDGLGGAPEFDLLGRLLTPTPEAPISAETVPPPTNSPGPESSPGASATPSAPTGIVTAQINVRSGPASSFDSLGLLNTNETVILTGQTLNGLWYQIQYSGGVGWAASGYIKLNSDISALPYFDNQGNPLPKP
ncbi:MAG: hypothetical protein OHK0031_11540 [Anaerolineales bacterium]